MVRQGPPLNASDSAQLAPRPYTMISVGQRASTGAAGARRLAQDAVHRADEPNRQARLRHTGQGEARLSARWPPRPRRALHYHDPNHRCAPATALFVYGRTRPPLRGAGEADSDTGALEVLYGRRCTDSRNRQGVSFPATKFTNDRSSPYRRAAAARPARRRASSHPSG